MDSFKDIDFDKHLQQAKNVALFVLYCLVIFLGCYMLFVTIGLLLRYLRIKLGSRVKVSPKKAILITGSTSGIGLTLAKRYLRKGFSVFATYFNSRELGFAELQDLAAGTSNKDENGSKLFLVHMDVRTRASIDIAATEIERLLKKHQMELYSVISNAGILGDVSLEFCPAEDIIKTIETNFTGSVLVCKRFVESIIKSRGRIVIVSSSASVLPMPFNQIYTATKSALRSFSVSLNEALRSYGASCRCVCPGHFMNQSNIVLGLARKFQDSVSKLNDEERKLYKKNIEENGTYIDKILKQRLEYTKHTKEDPEQLLAIYELNKPDEKSGFIYTRMRKVRDWFTASLTGRTSRPDNTIAGSGEMGHLNAFDSAVLMKNPPQRLFAGNALYQHIVAPFVSEYMPQAVIDIVYRIFEDDICARA